MINPFQSAAFAIQAHPGVYALLLGSGVSRSAGIATGWGIVLDLIGRLAVAANESVGPDPEQWYIGKFGEVPDYANLLDQLAKTPTERQQLLRPYFEPTDQEREDGLKQPTEAHRAIASLVRQGFIRVIVTTNFDRLMEKALEAEGVDPEVISSPEQLQGALPLTHVRCRVFKLHGDYLDPRIRNTPSELDSYSEEVDEHLDRILDEFGLVVCGWSADWDSALRGAINRTPSRRFTTYWATQGQPTDTAKRLIDHRSAEVIPIDDADSFFLKVQETVESIEEFSKPHPLSVDAAVASLKRYLPNVEHRIRLVDLIDETVEQLIVATSGEGFEIQGPPQMTREIVSSRLRHYESASSTLLAMAPIGGFWAEDDHYLAWSRALVRLGTIPRVIDVYHAAWPTVLTHPARLLIYALGMGAVESGRLRFLSRVFDTSITDGLQRGNPVPILSMLFDADKTAQFPWDQVLEGGNNGDLSLSYWVHNALRQPFKALIPDDDKYDLTFDKTEILIALGFRALEKEFYEGWVPPGAYIYRRGNRSRIVTEFTESISTSGNESPLVQSGIFGDTPEDCLKSLKDFDDSVTTIGRRYRGPH